MDFALLLYGWLCLGKGNAGGVTMKEKKEEKIITDPNGSYTGRPRDPEEKPIQDADDL